MEGTSVYAARKLIGAQLALESPVEADVVVPVPDSGVPAAMGFAEASGIAFELGHHPEPLCRADVYRADRPDPASGRAAEAFGEPRDP